MIVIVYAPHLPAEASTKDRRLTTQELPSKHSIDLDQVVYLSPADELANSVTHAVGFLLSLVALVFFWNITQDQELGLRICCGLFAISMALVYLFSTLSHVMQEPWRRYRMRAWDQGTIYLLISGTYSPFIWSGSPPGFTGLILATTWMAAALGFYSKVFSSHRINTVSTVTYVLLGWLPAIPLISHTPWICFLWMLIGGLCYTVGIVLLILSDRIRYSHAGWHLMVMLGSLSHCIAVYLLVHE